MDIIQSNFLQDHVPPPRCVWEVKQVARDLVVALLKHSFYLVDGWIAYLNDVVFQFFNHVFGEMVLIPFLLRLTKESFSDLKSDIGHLQWLVSLHMQIIDQSIRLHCFYTPGQLKNAFMLISEFDGQLKT